MLRICSRIQKGIQAIQLQISLKGIIFYRDYDMAKTFSSTQKYVSESIFSFKETEQTNARITISDLRSTLSKYLIFQLESSTTIDFTWQKIR